MKSDAYDRGHRICEATCFCGKKLFTFIAFVQHTREKHPKRLRAMKKSGELDQLRFDWPDRSRKGEYTKLVFEALKR